MQARCLNHGLRPAALKCRDCLGDFCRECASEHEGLLLCARCLEKRAAGIKPAKSPALAKALRSLSLAGGLLLLWMAFFACGRFLLMIPSAFHEGVYWPRLFGIRGD